MTTNLKNSLSTDFAKGDRYAHKLLYRNEMDYYNTFNRFGIIDPYGEMARCKEYIFFTKPDLQLLKSSGVLSKFIKNDPFFSDAYRRYPDVFEQLQYSYSKSGYKQPFIPMLSNSVSSSLDLPSITSAEIETSATSYGDSISYRWDSEASDVDHEFSLEFGESKYLEVYTFFKVWDQYCNKKARGLIPIPDKFVLNKILHDQISVYKIIVGEDHESIIFYAKLTGVYPKSVPREAFSSLDEHGGLKLSVNFKAAFVEDMDPIILHEFNHICRTHSPNNKDFLPIFENGRMNNEWATLPYIVEAPQRYGPSKTRYKLKWRK